MRPRFEPKNNRYFHCQCFLINDKPNRIAVKQRCLLRIVVMNLRKREIYSVNHIAHSATLVLQCTSEKRVVLFRCFYLTC